MTAPTRPHPYESGVGHMTAPEDVIGCCDRPRPDPVHVPKPPTRTCACPRILFGHLWQPDGCPPHPADHGRPPAPHTHPGPRYDHGCRACRTGVPYSVRA